MSRGGDLVVSEEHHGNNTQTRLALGIRETAAIPLRDTANPREHADVAPDMRPQIRKNRVAAPPGRLFGVELGLGRHRVGAVGRLSDLARLVPRENPEDSPRNRALEVPVGAVGRLSDLARLVPRENPKDSPRNRALEVPVEVTGFEPVTSTLRT